MVTMSIIVLIGYIAGAVGFVATMAAALVVVRSTTSKTTIQSQKELIDTLIAGKDEQKDQIMDLQKKHAESQNAIGNLQGQIDVLKNIPLEDIAHDLKQISSDQKVIAQEVTQTTGNQKEILNILNKQQMAGA